VFVIAVPVEPVPGSVDDASNDDSPPIEMPDEPDDSRYRFDPAGAL
jgi:hypothetical protein